MSIEEMICYDEIVAMGIATADELNLAFNMTDNGWAWTLNRVVFVRTGYQSLQDMIDAEDGE